MLCGLAYNLTLSEGSQLFVEIDREIVHYVECVKAGSEVNVVEVVWIVSRNLCIELEVFLA